MSDIPNICKKHTFHSVPITVFRGTNQKIVINIHWRSARRGQHAADPCWTWCHRRIKKNPMSAWCCLSKWTCWTHASDTAPATLQCCDPDVKIIKNYTPYRWQRRFLPFGCHHPVNLIVTYARKLLAFAQNSDWMNFDVAFSFFFFGRNTKKHATTESMKSLKALLTRQIMLWPGGLAKLNDLFRELYFRIQDCSVCFSSGSNWRWYKLELGKTGQFSAGLCNLIFWKVQFFSMTKCFRKKSSKSTGH